ncbi:MAG: hypothetical protein NC308_03470 [Clostridium sp.]|nr:hypothetical protein [Clostridium sp.]
MTEISLRELLPRLYGRQFSGISAGRADALSRMYLAYSTFLCTMEYDNICGRNMLSDSMESLYRYIRDMFVSAHPGHLEGFDRIESGANGFTWIRALELMYRLTKEVPMAINGEKDVECTCLYSRILPGVISSPGTEDEISAMRCIVYELGNVYGDRSGLDFYPWFRSVCLRWLTEVDASGIWPGLTVETAMERLLLLQDNSLVFSDSSLDSAAKDIYRSYLCRLSLPLQLTENNMAEYCAWHELMSDSYLYQCDKGDAGRLAGLIEDFAGSLPEYSDGWYMAMSYVVAQCCREAIAAAGESIFLEIA